MPPKTKFQELQNQLKSRKEDLKVFGRFAGDGRLMMFVTHPPRGTHPMKCSRATARVCITSFIQLGMSTHSQNGGLVWVLREWAEDVDMRIVTQQIMFGGEKAGFTCKMSAFARREFLKRVGIEDYV